MRNPFTIFRDYKILKRLAEMLEQRVKQLEDEREIQICQHTREWLAWREKEHRFNDFLEKFPFHLSSFSSKQDILRDVETFTVSGVERRDINEEIELVSHAQVNVNRSYPRKDIDNEIDYYKRSTYNRLIKSLVFKDKEGMIL